MRNWTPAQRRAIQYRDGNLLVSAAAGSGKTATLTEKVLRYLVEEENADVTRLLIVTFTKAAAAELKDRIAAGLGAAIREHPEDRRLVRTQAALSRAPISTIHSFCLSVLKPRFSELGLPPDFRVAEETENAILMSRVMEDAVSANLAEETVLPGEVSFRELAAALGKTRVTRALDEALLQIYEKLTSGGVEPETMTEAAGGLEAAAAFWRGETEERPALAKAYEETAARRTEEAADYFERRFAALAGTLAGEGPQREKCAALAADLSAMARSLRRRAADFREAKAYLAGLANPQMPRVKEADKTAGVRTLAEEKKAFLGSDGLVKTLLEGFYRDDPCALADHAAATARYARRLARFLLDFDMAFMEEKKRRGFLNFNDLERETFHLLIGEDGRPTAAAAELSEKFDAVFVDEYQDTNRVQDAIFAAVAGGKPRFLVGDIKQSIYAFRGADPSVFRDYRDAWREGGDRSVLGEGSTVVMAENFRCDLPVIRAANLFSEYFFPYGEISFQPEEDLLHFAKESPDPEAAPPAELLLCEKPAAGGEDPEPAAVADRIAAMIGRERKDDGTVFTAGDIVILLYSANASGQAFADALAARGIRSVMNRGEEFFRRPEILLALCLLHTVDNPSRDVYLAGCMRSPLFGFSLDDLVEIRLSLRGGLLWDAVRAYAETGPRPELRERTAGFVRRIRAFREAARGAGADRFLRYLFEETDLLDRGVSAGVTAAAERKNLIALYEMARQYESRVFGGLYGFLTYLRDLSEQEGVGVTVGADSGAVQIMSVHHSKGLEFPAVFLSETDKQFNTRDTRNGFLFSGTLGPAMKLPAAAGLVTYDHPLRRIAAWSLREELVREQMRVFYVAVTRARERLILTGTLEKAAERTETRREIPAIPCAYAVRKARCYLDWILDAVSWDGEAADRCLRITCLPAGTAEEAGTEAPAAEAAALTPDEESLKDVLRARMDAAYPYAYLTGLPAKLIVSKLYPGVIDPEEEEASAETLEKEPRGEPGGTPLRAKPAFLSEEPSHTAVEAGTATHAFMEYCDPERLTAPDGPRKELERLVRDGFLTEEMGSLVRLDEIGKFRESALFERMRGAREVRKEFGFYAVVPAAELTREPERRAALAAAGADVMVQGVVDLFLVDGDGHPVLVDYKTDRLTREELADPALAAEKMNRRHKVQLTYYRRACEKMRGYEIPEVYVYSLHLGDTVPIDTEWADGK